MKRRCKRSRMAAKRLFVRVRRNYEEDNLPDWMVGCGPPDEGTDPH